MRAARPALLALLTVAVAAACTKPETPAADTPSTAAPTTAPMPAGYNPNTDPAVQHVQQLLRTEGMERLPAVRVQLDSFTTSYRSGRTSLKDAAVTFGAWLDAYKAAHAAEVAALTAGAPAAR